MFNLKAKGMASYAKGFEFAFEQFKEVIKHKCFRENLALASIMYCTVTKITFLNEEASIPNEIYQQFGI